MSSIGIFYGSSTGNTKAVAEKIKSKLKNADLKDISAVSKEDISAYDIIILGASTWGLGDLQDDWEGMIDGFKALDLEGKKIAFFGTGDQEGYPDTFCDAVGLMYDAVKETKASCIGSWSPEGYSFDASKALAGDDTQIGLLIDEDNQGDLTDERIEKWVSILKEGIA